MADVLEYLLGHPVSAEDTFQLPQEKKLGDIRRGYASSGSAVDLIKHLIDHLKRSGTRGPKYDNTTQSNFLRNALTFSTFGTIGTIGTFGTPSFLAEGGGARMFREGRK